MDLFEYIYNAASEARLREGGSDRDTAYLIRKDANGNWHFILRADLNSKKANGYMGVQGRSKRTLSSNRVTYTVEPAEYKIRKAEINHELADEVTRLANAGEIPPSTPKLYIDGTVRWCMGTSLPKYGLIS